jgi:hypothetical protein
MAVCVGVCGPPYLHGWCANDGFFLLLKDIIPNLPNDLCSRVWFERLTGALLVPPRRVCVCVLFVHLMRLDNPR